jgi:hypothetical protein
MRIAHTRLVSDSSNFSQNHNHISVLFLLLHVFAGGARRRRPALLTNCGTTGVARSIAFASSNSLATLYWFR